MHLPVAVTAAVTRAEAAGFLLACEPDVGRLLSVLAAAVPPGGRILELGTGAGVGTAWLCAGLGDRTDVSVVTVEDDPARADLAAIGGWPPFVVLERGDGLEQLARLGPSSVDLLFADCPAGKHVGLDQSIAALRPGGVLIVDDMLPVLDWPDDLHAKQAQVRTTLFGHDDLVAVELRWSSGVILATKRA